MFLDLKRAFKAGWMLFARNSEVSFLNIFILTLVLIFCSAFFVFEKMVNFLILKVEEKADISVYFKSEVPEEKLLKLKDELEKMPEIDKIIFISKEKALEEFLARHKDDPKILEALQEVGNPFLDSFSIRVKDPAYFEFIVNFLEEKKEIIEKIDYFQRKPAIEKIFVFSKIARKIFYFGMGIISFLAILIVFVTTRLSLLSYREEIQIQTLVGVSLWKVRMPFLIEGGICGFFASILSISLSTLIAFFVSFHATQFLFGFDLFSAWKSNLILIFASETIIGIILGVLASFFSVERYLKV
ncbi:hypothetical protein H5T58_01385 [Candidatus Parcubacteria bacterium]|nr:hypothetical protein [Candidatus Parcubacteria bacterium]